MINDFKEDTNRQLNKEVNASYEGAIQQKDRKSKGEPKSVNEKYSSQIEKQNLNGSITNGVKQKLEFHGSKVSLRIPHTGLPGRLVER